VARDLPRRLFLAEYLSRRDDRRSRAVIFLPRSARADLPRVDLLGVAFLDEDARRLPKVSVENARGIRISRIRTNRGLIKDRGKR
jgi:hypothetical protein